MPRSLASESISSQDATLFRRSSLRSINSCKLVVQRRRTLSRFDVEGAELLVLHGAKDFFALGIDR